MTSLKFNIVKKVCGVLLVMSMLSGVAVSAYALELVPVGKTVGIELMTDGVLISSLAPVETASGEEYPAEDAGLLPGDIIIALGKDEIDNSSDFMEAAQELDGEPVAVQVIRMGVKEQFNLTPCKDVDGTFRLGVMLRDSVSGIGTVTYYNPDTGEYGALGHSINDLDTGVLLPVREGHISYASVSGVQKGVSGTPGKLEGLFDFDNRMGSISTNTMFGIFGEMSDYSEGEALTVAEPAEVQSGPAVIISQVDGAESAEYEVSITKSTDGATERLIVSIEDAELLALTGGIVQGMSGSPIIQDGKLVGAVTHVLVNDPTRGYGIFINDMLAVAEAA